MRWFSSEIVFSGLRDVTGYGYVSVAVLRKNVVCAFVCCRIYPDEMQTLWTIGDFFFLFFWGFHPRLNRTNLRLSKDIIHFSGKYIFFRENFGNIRSIRLAFLPSKAHFTRKGTLVRGLQESRFSCHVTSSRKIGSWNFDGTPNQAIKLRDIPIISCLIHEKWLFQSRVSLKNTIF